MNEKFNIDITINIRIRKYSELKYLNSTLT